MRDFLKDSRNQKLIVSILGGVLILAGIISLFYSQTKVQPSCSKKLESFNSNHMCINTSKGIMVFELYKDGGPIAVDRMTKLANETKFYDGLEFYRIVEGFVAQAGIQDLAVRSTEFKVTDEALRKKLDLLGQNGFKVETNFDKLDLTAAEKTELAKEKGYISSKDINPRKFEFGSISFANDYGPQNPEAKGNSTEFFIVTSKDANNQSVKSLNGRFTNLGKIVDGQNVLDAISSSKTDPNYPFYTSEEVSYPVEPIVIYEIRVK